MLRQLPAILIILLFTAQLFANNDKKVAKLENNLYVQYTNGDYKKALKIAESIVKLHLSEKNEKSLIKASHAQIKQAEILLETGADFTQVESLMNEAGKKISALAGAFSNDAFMARKNIALIYNRHGNHLKASETLNEAIKEAKTKNMGFDLVNELKIADISIKKSLGYYNEALKLTNELNDYVKSKISQYIEYPDPKTGKTVKKKLNKTDYAKSKREYAYFLNHVIELHIARGNIPSADSALEVSYQWIKGNLSTKDVSMADNHFLRGLLYDMKGEYVDMHKEMKIAYNNMKKGAFGLKYIYYNNKFINISSYLALSLYTNNDDKYAREYRNKLYSETKVYYKNTHKSVAVDLLDIRRYIAKADYKKAEKIILDLLDKKSAIPDNHPLRLEVYKLAQLIYTELEDLPKLREANAMAKSYYDTNYPASSPKYHHFLLEDAVFTNRYEMKSNEAKKVFDKSFTSIIKKQFHPMHPEFMYFMNEFADIHKNIDDYDNALKLQQEALSLAHQYFSKNKTIYRSEKEGYQHIKLAQSYFELGKLKDMRTHLDLALSIYEKSIDPDKAEALILEARINILMGKIKPAKKTLESAKSLIDKAFANSGKSKDQRIELVDFARLDLLKGSYDKSEKTLKFNVEQLKSIYGSNSRKLIQEYNLLAELNLTKGDFNVADKYITASLDIVKKSYNDKSTKLAETLFLQGQLQTAYGDYEQAIQTFNTVLKIQNNNFGNNSLFAANTKTEMAMAMLYQSDPNNNKIKSLLEEAANDIENSFDGQTSPAYAKAIQNLAFYYIKTNDLNKAEEYLNKAELIWTKESKLGKNNKEVAEITLLKSEILKAKGKYNEAIRNNETAVSIFEKVFDKTHPRYVYALSKLGQLQYINGDQKAALQTISTTTQYYREFVKSYFNYLGEREKSKFWNLIKSDFEFYNTLAFNNMENDSKLIEQVYNNTLNTKALLLNSSIKVRQTILNSNDETLIELYNDWVNKKEKLASTLAYSNEELKEDGINRDDLVSQINEIEKKLSEKSSLFNVSSKKTEITWDKVKNTLNQNEYAIEIVRYRYFDKSFSDSIIYAALIINKDTKKQPKVVIIPEGNDLESKYIKYYQNVMRHNIKDQFSYNAFWKPIHEIVGDNNLLYISPDGVYNQINIESIPLPDGTNVLDKTKIVTLSNTKDLLDRQKTTIVSTNNTAVLVGNPAFYQKNIDSKEHLNAGTWQKIKQLPGAEKEVRLLNQLLVDKKWDTDLYIYDNTKEENIKLITSPRILHFATHGFFIEGKSKNNDLIEFDFDDRKTIVNPLLKSGLMLQYAGDIVENKDVLEYNIEHGVLTAYEAMNLNLDKTELVIMSACETGLGEVQIGEGVYGLQRAFLVAGAKSIIMSLFKISDEVTTELMNEFYKNWLKSGDKRESFIEAKKYIRDKHKNPVYWGAFVMMGLD